MEMEIYFPENMKAVAKFENFEVVTDQKKKYGGDESAPEPLKLFFASIGTCAGVYILSFLKERKINTKGIKVTLKAIGDKEKKMYTKVILDIQLPHDFPEKYKNAIIKSAELCSVKKHIFDPPQFEINASIGS
ncbi:OsmC family protein [bacterium]|nr:OsmC family protein [bacterium]